MTKIPSGDLILTDGISRGARWNGQTPLFHFLGIDTPTVAPTITLSTVGGATAGTYQCCYRWKDLDGNFSSISPLTAVVATNLQRFIWTITAPTNADSRITHVELWRTTSGQSTTLYRVTTLAIALTTFTTDTATDAALLAAAALDTTSIMSVVNPNGSASARRFTPPPTFKAVSSFYQDRMWYGVDVEYNAGTATFSFNSTTVSGQNTAWTSDMAGRYIYNANAGRWYEISSVVSGTSLILTEVYAGTTQTSVSYAIRTDHTERNQLYFSEANEPESVPATNVVKAQQSLSFTDDEIVGLQTHNGYLYVLKNRSTLRLKYVQQPQIDTSVTLAAQRGAFNNRCWDMVEDIAYVMDEFGPYRFDGSSVDPIGHKIMDAWRDGTIDFSVSKWFFVKVSPQEEVARFYVCISGETRPKRAFCYHYRLNAWWVETYYTEIGGACVHPISSRPRLLLGAQSDIVLLSHQGSADGTDTATETGTMRGTVDTATSTAILDTSATFTASQVGCPLAIIDGTGKGQERIISSLTATSLNVSAAFSTTPDSTSVYLVGAIPWSYKTKTLEYAIRDKEVDRSARLTYQPTTLANQFDIRRILNHNTSPENNAITFNQGDGVKFTRSDPDAVVNMLISRATYAGSATNAPGFARFEFDGKGSDKAVVDRWLTLHLRGYQATEAIRLYGIDVEGAR